MGNGEAPALFTMDDTGENYVPYTPPEPPAFKETLPEDLRGSEHLEDDVDGVKLARYYVDSKTNQPVLPDSAEGYDFEAPEGFDLDTDTYSKFKELAFEKGITQDQFKTIMGLETERYQSTVEAFEKRIAERQEAAVAELKEAWGAEYEKKLEAANNFLGHEAIVKAVPGLTEFLKETRLGDNPTVIKLFSFLADTVSEDAFVKPGTGAEGAGPKIGEDGRPMLRFPTMEGNE